MVEARPLRSLTPDVGVRENKEELVPSCRGDLAYSAPMTPAVIAHVRRTCGSCPLMVTCLGAGKKNRETGFYGGQYLDRGAPSTPRLHSFSLTEAFRFDGSAQGLEERLREVLQYLVTKKDFLSEARNLLSRSRIAGRFDVALRVYQEFPALRPVLAETPVSKASYANEGEPVRVSA